jgi:hypothetical protein
MIILKKIGRQEIRRVMLSDPLFGVADGVNQTFSTFYEYTPGRIEIVYKGQVLTSPDDFEETGPQEITFRHLNPSDISLFSVSYETHYFTNPTIDIQEGVTNIISGISSIFITFAIQLSSRDYVLTVNLENSIDAEPSIYPILIRNKTINGFTVDFSEEMDSDNYYLNWKASLPI